MSTTRTTPRLSKAHLCSVRGFENALCGRRCCRMVAGDVLGSLLVGWEAVWLLAMLDERGNRAR